MDSFEDPRGGQACLVCRQAILDDTTLCEACERLAWEAADSLG